jgi:hypothetical protein
MRDKFEVAARQLGYDLTRHELGFYLCRSTNKAWLLWQLCEVGEYD